MFAIFIVTVMRMYYQVIFSFIRSRLRLLVPLPQEKSFKGGCFHKFYNLPSYSFIRTVHSSILLKVKLVN